MSRYIQAGGPRQRFQSACGDAPSDAFLAGVNVGSKLLEFHQLSWRESFSSSGCSSQFLRTVKEEHLLINRIIAKESTAYCQNLHPSRLVVIEPGPREECGKRAGDLTICGTFRSKNALTCRRRCNI